jgi:hypothetical protein
VGEAVLFCAARQACSDKPAAFSQSNITAFGRGSLLPEQHFLYLTAIIK